MSIVSIATKTTDLDGLPVLISLSCGSRNIELPIKDYLYKMTPEARDCISDEVYKAIETNGLEAMDAFSHLYYFIQECDNPVMLAHNIDFERKILANFCEDLEYPSDYIESQFHRVKQDIQQIVMYMMNQVSFDLNSYKLTDLLDTFDIKQHHNKAVNQQKLYVELVNLMDVGKPKAVKCKHCYAMAVEDGECWLCGSKQ